MQLRLRIIRWKNFLSTGNIWTEIDLSARKTTLMVGENGSGKSTLLDALSFVLFNKPFRKINKPQLINSITNKDCVVELEFEINGSSWKAVRGMKPDIFEIYKAGKLIPQPDSNRDYQKDFEKNIIRTNHKTFCQLVALGSAIFIPFMALTTPDRRKIIEDLLDLEIFSKMNVLLKSKVDVLEKNLLKKEHEKRLLEERINLTEKHKEEQVAAHKQAVEVIDATIVDINKALEDLQKEFDEIDKQLIQKAEPAYGMQNRLIPLKTELRVRFESLHRQMKFFQEKDHCPTCTQVLTDDFRKASIENHEKEILEVEELQIGLNSRIKNADEKVKEVEEIKKIRHKIENQILALETRSSLLKSQKADYLKQLSNYEQKAMNLDLTALGETKAELAELVKELIERADDKAVMSYATQLLKDSGIKAKIIKNFIPVINKLINKNLAALNFFVEFTLDEQFTETILSRYRDNFSYASFSEGEKMRLNLAILFTWREVARLRSSINCNLLVFDELFDSSVDSRGISDIMQLLGRLTGEDNIIIISHREDQLIDHFDRVIRFQKRNNFSKALVQ